MSPADRLALEHLTAPAASPLQIVELAAAQGWAAATVLVAPFAAFPQTAGIDLVGDRCSRRAVRRACARGGVTLALAYPFVLSRRTGAAALEPALEAAAEIGARGVGVLLYERDGARAADALAAFCDLAAGLGVRPAVEVFGGSALPTLAAAQDLWARTAPPAFGLCLDLLHLVRSGGGVAALARARAPIVHAQLSDAPRRAPIDRDAEATCGRLAPGDGELDIGGFVAAVPESVWLGVEVPSVSGDAAEQMERAVRTMRRARDLLERDGAS